MRVVIKLRKPDPIWDTYLKKLKEEADTFILYDSDSVAVFQDVEVMITTNLSRKTLSCFPVLKKIFLFKTGMDGLPLDELQKRNISVICSHANADVIAEHALSLALSLLHRVPEFHNDLCRGVWYSDGLHYNWRSIGSFCIGILGFGHIGKCLYQKLLPMNKHILVLNKSGKYPEHVQSATSFEEMTEKCDLLFICVPKTEETIDLFDETALHRMKHAYLINVARAEICNEKALFEALAQNHLAGYASDVWYHKANKTDRMEKIMPSDYPFETLSNVVMSPHCATHDLYSHERYIRSAVESCISYLQTGAAE